VGPCGARSVHPPEAMMHFPPLLQIFLPIFENFLDFLENFLHFTFSRKNFPFSSAKISDDLFLVINHKFRISPLFFAISIHFRPYFAKIILSPILFKISLPVFPKFTCFWHTLCFSFPPPALTMLHLCITQCTYWTPLHLKDILNIHVAYYEFIALPKLVLGLH